QEARIKKVNEQGKVTFAGNDLRQVFDDDGIRLVRLLDRDGLLYCYDPGFGWYIFDYYGALKQKVPVAGLTDLAVTDGVISGRLPELHNQLWLFRADPQTLSSAPRLVAMPGVVAPDGASQLRQSLFLGSARQLIVLTPEGVTVNQFEIP